MSLEQLVAMVCERSVNCGVQMTTYVDGKPSTVHYVLPSGALGYTEGETLHAALEAALRELSHAD